MRIVFANKYHFLKGGAERYASDLAALLQAHGHEVFPFAMQDPRNEKSSWSKFFVSNVQTDHVSYGVEGLRTAGRFVFSYEARRKFSELARETKPELLHVHNIYHQLSPSFLPMAKARGIPVVMTVHDYAMIAPNYSLFHDGAICEITKPDKYWAAAEHRCVKGSKAASALDAFALSLHKRLGLYSKNVDRYIAPSRFVQALLAEYGVDPAKIVHIPHPIDVRGWTPSSSGSYVLFVGRLSEEKGVETLIQAAALRKDIPVRIVGTGPDEARLRSVASELGATNVEFRGWRAGSELRTEYSGARCVVVPSEWYEVFGLTVLEAYAAGKPVVASQIGGLGEMVKDGETGLLCAAGNPLELSQKMGALWDAPDAAAHMGATARAWVERDFTPEQHYARIMEVYAAVGAKVK